MNKKNRKKISLYLIFINLFFVLLIFTLIISYKTFLYSDEKSVLELELLHTEIIDLTNKIRVSLILNLDNDINLDECYIRPTKQNPTQKYILDTNMNLNFFHKNLNYVNQRITLNDSSLINSNPTRLIDLDKDNIKDELFLCTQNSICPKSFGNAGLVVNLSRNKKLVYFKFESLNKSSINLNKPFQDISNYYSSAINDNMRLTLIGKTSHITNVIGLNDELIYFINSFYDLSFDLDLDGKKDYFTFDDGKIILFLTKEGHVFDFKINLSDSSFNLTKTINFDNKNYGIISIASNFTFNNSKNKRYKIDILPIINFNKFGYEPILNSFDSINLEEDNHNRFSSNQSLSRLVFYVPYYNDDEKDKNLDYKVFCNT
jgi:hypothetical protein